MLKKLLLTTVTVLGLALSSFAGNNTNSTSYFNGNELSVFTSSSYQFDNGFSKEYDFNLNVGAKYFVNRYLGLEAGLPIYNTHNVSIDRVSAALVTRLPIKSIAPYGAFGSTYLWNSEDFTYFLKGGLEWRPFNPKWGLFGEYQYSVKDFNRVNIQNGDQSINVGLSLVF